MEEKSRDELSEASVENVAYIIDWIKKKVNLVNSAVINHQHIDLAHYDTLLDLYDLLRRKERLTMSELDGVLEELAQMRKKV